MRSLFLLTPSCPAIFFFDVFNNTHHAICSPFIKIFGLPGLSDVFKSLKTLYQRLGILLPLLLCYKNLFTRKNKYVIAKYASTTKKTRSLITVTLSIFTSELKFS